MASNEKNLRVHNLEIELDSIHEFEEGGQLPQKAGAHNIGVDEVLPGDTEKNKAVWDKTLRKYTPRVAPLLSTPLITSSVLANYFGASVVGGGLSNISSGILFFSNGISVLNNNSSIEENRNLDSSTPIQPMFFGRKSAVTIAILNFVAGISIIANIVLTALDEDKASDGKTRFSSYIVGLAFSQLIISFLAGISAFIQNRQMNAFSKETKKQLSLTIQTQKKEIAKKDDTIGMKDDELYQEKLSTIQRELAYLSELLALSNDSRFAIQCEHSIDLLKRLIKLDDDEQIKFALSQLEDIQNTYEKGEEEEEKEEKQKIGEIIDVVEDIKNFLNERSLPQASHSSRVNGLRK